MTTHDKKKIIAAARESDKGFDPESGSILCNSLVGREAIERFYAIAFEAGAASQAMAIAAKDAEIAELVAALEHCKDWFGAAGLEIPVEFQAREALAKVRKIGGR